MSGEEMMVDLMKGEPQEGTKSAKKNAHSCVYVRGYPALKKEFGLLRLLRLFAAK
jgi:hypothetical protein